MNRRLPLLAITILFITLIRILFSMKRSVANSVEKHIIVVGTGLSGLTATNQLLQLIEALGLETVRVSVLDKQASFGGNSIKASSGINGAWTKFQEAQGISDGPEQFALDTIKSANHFGNTKLMDILAFQSSQSISWLTDQFGVDLSLVSKLGGHSNARTHRGSGKLPPGFALTSALFSKIQESDKVSLLFNSKVESLITSREGSKLSVTGVRYRKDNTFHEIYGPVILATGGYAASPGLLKDFAPEATGLPTTNGVQSTGDGILMAKNIGASLIDMSCVQIHPTGFVDPKAPQNPTKILAGEVLRGNGGVLLNKSGKRFVDELQTRDVVSAEVFKQDGSTAYLVLGAYTYEMVEHYVDFYCSKGLMEKTNITAFAKKLNVARESVGLQFKSVNQQSGSFTHNGRMLFPFEETDKEDIYVGQVAPVVHFTMGGVKINEDAEVIDASGNVISGLYAIGEVSGGVHGANRLGGSSLLECVVFGRIAANHAVNILV